MASHSPLIPTEDEDFDAVSGPLKPRKPRSPNKNSDNAKLTAVVTAGLVGNSQAVEPVLEQNPASDEGIEQVAVDVKSTRIDPVHLESQVAPVIEPSAAIEPQDHAVSDDMAQINADIPSTAVANLTEITHHLNIPDSDELDAVVEDLFADYVPTQPKKYEKPSVVSSFATKPAFVAPRAVITELTQEPIKEPVSTPVSLIDENQVDELRTVPVSAEPASRTRGNRARRMPSLPSLPHIGGKRLAFELALVLAIIGIVGVANKTNHQKQQVQADLSSLRANPEVALQQQTDNLIKTVGQLVSLPSGETPTVANVSNAEQAKQQSAFFANAQNGDKVLMYVKAKQAILYRPATDNIILVAPLTFNNAAQTQANSGTTTLPTSKTAGAQIKP